MSIFSTSGRIGRNEYISIFLGCTVLGVALGALFGWQQNAWTARAVIAFSLPAIWVWIVATIKRCRDLNISGWASLILIIPLLNLGFQAYLLVARRKNPAADSALPHQNITASPKSLSASTDGFISDTVYEQIGQEIESNSVDRGVWTRAFLEANGDEQQTKVAYIRLRAAQLNQAPVSSDIPTPLLIENRTELEANTGISSTYKIIAAGLLGVLVLVFIVSANSTKPSTPSTVNSSPPTQSISGNSATNIPTDDSAGAPPPMSNEGVERFLKESFANISFSVTPKELIEQGFGCSSEGFCKKTGPRQSYENHIIDEFNVRFVRNKLRSITLKFSSEHPLTKTQVMQIVSKLNATYPDITGSAPGDGMQLIIRDWLVKNNVKVSLFAARLGAGKYYDTTIEYINHNIEP